jgi:hypothetical protein
MSGLVKSLGHQFSGSSAEGFPQAIYCQHHAMRGIDKVEESLTRWKKKKHNKKQFLPVNVKCLTVQDA